MYLDIIIPLFNSYDTIYQTLGSLACQQLSKMLDVYLFDDGTVRYDKEKEKQPYEHLYNFYKECGAFHSISLAHNEKNMGIGQTRDKAMRETSNDYLMFLDSDDYLYSPYAINKIYYLINKYPQAKMIYTSVMQEYQSYKEPWLKTKSDFVYNNPDEIDKEIDMDKKGNILQLHGRVWQRAAMVNSGLTFPHTRSNEDIAFNLGFFHLQNKEGEIIFSPCHIVCTCCNPNSITRDRKNSTRASFGVVNVNEVMDCQIACKQTFEQYCGKGIIPNLENSYYWIDRQIQCVAQSDFTKEKSLEEKTLYDDIMVLYYKDICYPILKNAAIEKIEIKEDSFVLGNKPSSFDIKKYARKKALNFNQEQFDILCKKYLTDVAYQS